MAASDAAVQENNVQDIELIDIEDIVPTGGNSLFLSCARAILYYSHKNPTFINAMQACCDINLVQIKSDLALQALLRQRLCDYFCNNGTLSERESNSFHLREAYSKHFKGNIYDFLIQVYQLSINNFSNNALYRKYALISISQVLNMKIFYKRANGQWKMYEPFTSRQNENLIKNPEKITPEKQSQLDYLNECVIYLQEFRAEDRSSKSCNKVIRVLLNKKLWLSKFANNSKICMNFTQFNDEAELKAYQKHFYTIDPKLITDVFSEKKQNLSNGMTKSVDLTFTRKIFCVFLHYCPVALILSAENNPANLPNVHSTVIERTIMHSDDFEYTQEFNTIGKQFYRFEALGIVKLYQYLNNLCGRPLFNNEFVIFKYSLIENID